MTRANYRGVLLANFATKVLSVVAESGRSAFHSRGVAVVGRRHEAWWNRATFDGGEVEAPSCSSPLAISGVALY